MSDATATTSSTRYELRERTAWIHLTRPDKRNALDPDVLDGIAAGLDQATDDDARVVVLTGSGPAFCAGADLSHVLDGLADLSAIEDLLATAGRLTMRMEAFPSPIIAAVNGAAIAGGLELVLACDLVVAAESATVLRRSRGVRPVPRGRCLVRLPRLIGANRARHLLFTAETLDGRRDAAPSASSTRSFPRTSSRRRSNDWRPDGPRQRDALARMKRVIQVGSRPSARRRARAGAGAGSRDTCTPPMSPRVSSAFAERRRPSFSR